MSYRESVNIYKNTERGREGRGRERESEGRERRIERKNGEV